MLKNTGVVKIETGRNIFKLCFNVNQLNLFPQNYTVLWITIIHLFSTPPNPVTQLSDEKKMLQRWMSWKIALKVTTLGKIEYTQNDHSSSNNNDDDVLAC